MLGFGRIWVSMGAVRHPASYPMGAMDSSLEVKRPRREADHSPPSNAEVKTAWSYTSTPQSVYVAWCLVKYRDNFTCTFTDHCLTLTDTKKESFWKLLLPPCSDDITILTYIPYFYVKINDDV
jgi:hypothetical protein